MIANGKKASCEFIVFEGVRDNLLGFRSCIDLGLIQLTYAIKAEDDFAKEVKAKKLSS